DGTAFVDLFAAGGPVVIVAATKSIQHITLTPTNAQAQLKVDNNGGLYQATPSTWVFYETWLDSGTNDQVWVERIIISGTLNNDPGAGRKACTSDRFYSVLQQVVGIHQCVIDIKFWDAASGGTLLDTQRVTLYAEESSFD
ncbi:MAG: hypothetical protein J3T61_09100, partial [Candidatus Brocadiales bacterium]|nr:hypothetical protein [Candidatus Bathyanammoxibius sp.]